MWVLDVSLSEQGLRAIWIYFVPRLLVTSLLFPNPALKFEIYKVEERY
jgi:hypothetical protein